MNQSETYMLNLHNAIFRNYENCMVLYGGVEGAKRLAREFGYGIPDSPKHEWESAIFDSYGSLCVRVYNLNPPIDAKVWVAEIYKSMSKRLGYELTFDILKSYKK